MLLPLSTATLTLLSGLSLSPASVPATGSQETILTVDTPSAVKFSAKGPSGTSCTIVDRVRGPFASSGNTGRTNCELDLLLDSGEYKIRLESPLKGKGQVAISAAPYTEINSSVVQLQPGASVVTALGLGQTASYWVRVGAPMTPYIHVVGRTAGDVKLWRNGTWLEPLTFTHNTRTFAGVTVHDWWVDTQLEAGDYQVVVYGKSPAGDTVDSKNNTLTVTSGFIAGPPEKMLSFTIPASGSLAVEVSTLPQAALLMATSPLTQPLTLTRFNWGGTGRMSSGGSCSISEKAALPQCMLDTTNSTARRVLMIEGAPGTTGHLEWPTLDSGLGTAGFSAFGGRSANFVVTTAGKKLIALHDLNMNIDDAPLGCLLESVKENGETIQISRLMTKVGDGKRLIRPFNYTGGGQQVWFETTGSGKFKIKTSGERKNRCEIYRFETNGKQTRMTQSKPEAVTCAETLSLSKGQYVVELIDGLSGIETISIEEEAGFSLFGSKPPTSVPAMVSCAFPEQELARGAYRLSTNSYAGYRGLAVMASPVERDQPVHLTLEPGASISLELGAGKERIARALGTSAISCSLKKTATSMKNGACVIPSLASQETLTLTNRADIPTVITVSAEIQLPPIVAPQSFVPRSETIQQLKAGEPAFFDFTRSQSHSVIFEVSNPGLYRVTTQGLLSTSCMLRTQVASNFASDSNSGRGRNCLISTALQKGRYMMTATTLGASVGRASLLMTRRNARDVQTQNGEGETFFRAEADDLIQQNLVVPSSAEWNLNTSGQGQSLTCRLDDPQGWPVEVVPSPCADTRSLKAGTYKWTQMPLTVESMRHTTLKKVREEVVLRGNAAHKVEFFNWYSAELGADGKDELLFSLSGDSTLDIVLSGGMQGRVYRQEGTAWKPAEVIPPSAFDARENAASSESEGEGESDSYAPREANEDGESEGSGDENGNENNEERAPAVRTLSAQKVPPPPHGAQISLTAGSYKIIAEHSRGDVGITYRIHLGSLSMLPGMSRTVPVPSSMQILIPADGTLRLRTEGEADVRCRLFNSSGLKVIENGDNGNDWNCSIAEPIVKGTYRLDIESETQQAGETKLTISVPATEDKGVLADATTFNLGGAVTMVSLPPSENDVVHDVQFISTGGQFSCALENELGAVVARQLRSKTCSLLVRPGKNKFRIRLWGNEGTVQVKSKWSTRTANPVGIANAGRYALSSAASCISGSEYGPLTNCWPETSLEAGSAVFAVTGSTSVPSLSEAKTVASDTAVNATLTRRPLIQRVTANGSSVFLMRATAPHGSLTSPACAFDGVPAGRESRARECFAVSKVGTEATGRTWVASNEDLAVSLTRRAIPMPMKVDALTAGRKHVTFTNTGLFALPGGAPRIRVSVTLPKDGLAVLFDEKDVPQDLCAPSDTLRQCVMTAAKGKLLIASSTGEADVTATLIESEPRSIVFTGLHEFEAREAGSLRLPIQASSVERTLSVTGAQSCALVLDDGNRITDCSTRVAAGRNGTLFVEHEAGAVRALLSLPGRERATRINLEVPLVPGSSLSASVATPLAGARIDRTLVLDKDAVVRIAADTGVCALFKGNELIAVEGMNTGCEIVRVLTAGNYRVLVRPFADLPLSGVFSWSSESVTALNEGVGAETWLSAGDVRLYKFTTNAPGKVGLGVQTARDSLDCSVLNDAYKVIGEGCQQYLTLPKGSFLLVIKQPARAGSPIAFKPVLLGLSGDKSDVPQEFLKDFFNRVQSN